MLWGDAVDRVAASVLPVSTWINITAALNDYAIKSCDQFMSSGNCLFNWLCLNGNSTCSGDSLAIATAG